MTKTTLPVIGMDCASCSNIVNRAIKKTPGVTGSEVNLATEKANIEFDETAVSLDQINDNVKKFGYSLDTSNGAGKVEDHMHHTPIEHLDILKKQVEFLFPNIWIYSRNKWSSSSPFPFWSFSSWSTMLSASIFWSCHPSPSPC
ncbi:MAG: Heavy metal translocating P-type ATPase [Candidatus Collierbacteria bacterium GW2011_GWA2_44_13]|nr:MAG: Heavy metal translocating P-type ATPase [Candidatus Collierbacteria bacterium GW2011_GWA2_44_13]